MKALANYAPVKYSGKILQLKDYLSSVPPAPSKCYFEYKVPKPLWGMFSNDTIGDCTCACIAHMIMCATAHTGTMFAPGVADVVSAYSAITGYVPGNESTDNGAAIPDVLNYWQNIGISGHKITAWAQIDVSNLEQVKQAIWLFGGVDIGIDVYDSMERQFDAHQPWDNASGENLGGHSVPVFGYGTDGCTCVTWAELQQMGWPMFSKICSEVYAVITPDWINQLSGKTYSGFDLAQLNVDLDAMKQ